jgi:hypothetical protein
MDSTNIVNELKYWLLLMINLLIWLDKFLIIFIVNSIYGLYEFKNNGLFDIRIIIYNNKKLVNIINKTIKNKIKFFIFNIPLFVFLAENYYKYFFQLLFSPSITC